MNKRGVTTLEVLVTGLFILVVAVILYEGIVFAIKKHKEEKFYEHLEEINAQSNDPSKFPCDHGTACNFKIHGEHMWCEYHKMYHHRDRSCMHNADLEKLEDAIIRKRESELGIVRTPKPVKFKPDEEFNKRR